MGTALSHRVKLCRAKKHLQALDQQVVGYLDGYGTRTEIDPQASEARAHLIKPDEPRWGPLLGDCLYNLRSVLDHIVFELAEATSGSPLPKKIAEKSAWPVAKASKEFADSRIKGVCKSARTIIKDLQPYKYAYGLTSDPIWILDKLANIDKHRAVHVITVGTLMGIGGVAQARRDVVLRGEAEWINPDVVKDGAIVGRVAIEITGPRPKVDMMPMAEFKVALDEGAEAAPGEGVVELLERIMRYIETTVLPPLEALL